MGQTLKTQNAAILHALEVGLGLTALVALKRYGCLRLAARIHDLRSQGHLIQAKKRRVGKKFVSVYWMEG